MKRTRVSAIAAALALGLASVLAVAVPAVATTTARDRGIRPAVVSKFAIESMLNIAVEQRCIGIGPGRGNASAWTCTDVNDQNWHRGGQFKDSGYYQLVNDKNQCLGVVGGSTAKGARVVGGKCEGTSHHDQYWTIDYISSHTYECWIFNYKSGYVLEVKNASLANGTPVIQEPWVNHPAGKQLWSIQFDSP